MSDVLYDKKLTCLLCKYKFKTKKVRHSRLRLIKEHSDFYREYEGINPNYYLVNVCPKCGYAYTDQFTSPKPSHKEEIEKKVSNNWVSRDFGIVRDFNMALDSLKLAVFCGQIQGEKYNILATLLLHTAWIYREQNDEQNEMRFLKLAREQFLKVYQEDTSKEVNLAKLLFLLGELSKRIGGSDEAVTWFSKLVSDRNIQDEKMITRARDQWMLIKKENDRTG
ncbi:DUF2225 domain-containing protein [Natranaerobius trueperi]|nr:DUF2225 domain-containing protein [Natranaerobius trueperi]